MPLPDPILDRFRAYLRLQRSESTAQKYGQAAEKFIAFCSNHRLRLDHLPPGILTLFSEYLSSAGLRPSSVHTMTAGVKKFLGWLRAHGLITGDAFAAPDLPKITQEAPNVASTQDLVAFLQMAAAQPEPQRTILLLLPFTGLRSDELTHLDLRSISRVDTPIDGGTMPLICLTVRGKGGDVRVVPMLPDGMGILIHYLQTWRKEQPPGSWLFPMPDGGPIANRTLRHYVQQIRERIGMAGQRLTPHTMRRTYATALYHAGVDVPTLTKIMGHKSVQTTMTHYLEISPVDLAGAVGRSGAALLSKGPYAESVFAAGREASDFLASLPKRKL